MTAITDPNTESSNVTKKPGSFLDEFQKNGDASRGNDAFSAKHDGIAPAAVIGPKIKIRGELGLDEAFKEVVEVDEFVLYLFEALLDVGGLDTSIVHIIL